MPEELRRLFFNINEVVHALTSYRTAHPQFLPEGAISHLEIAPDKVTVTVQVKYFDSVNALDIVVPLSEMQGPLVDYCIDHDIPLPPAGNRRVSAIDERVVFEIERDYEEVERKDFSVWTRLRGRIA